MESKRNRKKDFSTAPKNANWPRIKAEYVNTMDSSYKKLAEKYGLSEGIISERGSKENWTALKRKKYLKIVELVDREVEGDIVQQQVRLLKESFFVGGRGLAGMATHFPRSAREAKEMWEAAANVQLRLLFGANHSNTTFNFLAPQNNPSNKHISFADFVDMMRKRGAVNPNTTPGPVVEGQIAT